MAGGKSYRGWKPAKAQHKALTQKQPIPSAKTFRAISALAPVPDQSKMTATQALTVQRTTERTAPFPEKVTASPEVLEGEILPPRTEQEMEEAVHKEMVIKSQQLQRVMDRVMLCLIFRQT